MEALHKPNVFVTLASQVLMVEEENVRVVQQESIKLQRGQNRVRSAPLASFRHQLV